MRFPVIEKYGEEEAARIWWRQGATREAITNWLRFGSGRSEDEIAQIVGSLPDRGEVGVGTKARSALEMGRDFLTNVFGR
jgi:hypothetical protein